jgi:hypothetical protein
VDYYPETKQVTFFLVLRKYDRGGQAKGGIQVPKFHGDIGNASFD